MLDADDIEWEDLALCANLPLNNFFEGYENDPEIAKNTDDLCLSCPVRLSCLQFGADTSQTGVWGAVYLINGRVDTQRNAHKTKDIWKLVKKP